MRKRTVTAVSPTDVHRAAGRARGRPPKDTVQTDALRGGREGGGEGCPPRRRTWRRGGGVWTGKTSRFGHDASVTRGRPSAWN